MKKMMNKANILLAIALVAIISITVTSCKKNNGQGTANSSSIQSVAVITETVQKGVVEQIVTLTSELEPVEIVHLSPKISGRLERLATDGGIAVEENTAVTAGQVLAVLEHRDLQAQADRAEAAVKTAEAALKQAVADLEEKQRDKTRMENLCKQGSATEKQRDLAVTSWAVAQAAVESVRAQQAEAMAALRQARVMLDEAFIKSPLTGIVSHKYVDCGNMVNSGSPIVTILPMEQFKIIVNVPTHYMATVDPNTADIHLHVDAWPKETFPARVTKMYSAVNPQTRTFTLELSVQNRKTPDSAYMLRPGMYITAQVVLSRSENVVVVPADSLIRLSDKYLAYVVEKNTAKRRNLEVGLWSGNRMEIKSGLEAGEQLIVSGQHKLTDGTPVEVIKTQSVEGTAQQ